MSVKPISPSEALDNKNTEIPDFVIEAFNQLIVKNLRDGRAVVKQDDAMNLAMKKARQYSCLGYTSDEILNNGWMDVEPVFRKAGWTVNYDKPAYCENYPATFEFKRRGKR